MDDRDQAAGGVFIRGRAEIDTRPPFRSVKEAVTLFGEKYGEIYANKLKEIETQDAESRRGQPKIAVLTVELEETKQSLEKAREESNLMSNSIKTLRQELEQTKKELQRVRAREFQKQRVDPEIEDLKFIENATKRDNSRMIIREDDDEEEEPEEFQKKRYVKFASPPSLARVIVSKEETARPLPAVGKNKKKPLIHVIGWLFSKKKGSQEVESPAGRNELRSPQY